MTIVTSRQARIAEEGCNVGMNAGKVALANHSIKLYRLRERCTHHTHLGASRYFPPPPPFSHSLVSQARNEPNVTSIGEINRLSLAIILIARCICDPRSISRFFYLCDRSKKWSRDCGNNLLD